MSPIELTTFLQTIYGQFEQKYEGFDIKVKQSVPDLNWSVVPSPEIQVCEMAFDQIRFVLAGDEVD